MDVYLVIVHALLILRKSRGYTIPCNELDGGDERVRQLGNFNFANNTALIIGSEGCWERGKPLQTSLKSLPRSSSVVSDGRSAIKTVQFSRSLQKHTYISHVRGYRRTEQTA